MSFDEMQGNELKSLYQDVIVDHGRRPRNFGEIEAPNRHADGLNPLCGDELTVSLHIEDGLIDDIGFTGSGCAISQASASLMTVALKGKPASEALELFNRVHELLTEDPAISPPVEGLGKLEVLSGVWEFPTRVKCASLAWQALRAAIEAGDPDSTDEGDLRVTTEN